MEYTDHKLSKLCDKKVGDNSRHLHNVWWVPNIEKNLKCTSWSTQTTYANQTSSYKIDFQVRKYLED